ncbi:hypothetical protein Tco_1392914 [Tanacetum coccineum]
MSTSNTSTNSNKKTLADSGANERPLMLEKGNYIPWESRFRRFLDNKPEEGERMWNSIQNGPYQRPMVVDPRNPTVPILELLSKMTEGNKKQYIADVRVMKYLLQVIPNDIYNSVDACKNAKEMWEQIKRLTTLVNIIDRNNVRPIPVVINTKFLNCLQPEWSKYVTMVRHNQIGPAVSYDVLYDQLVQFKPHVLASRAKKATKNHDPLALIAHSNTSSSHSHANSSYSTQPYYVTHPPSVVDYDDEYQGELQGDSQEDKLTTSMMMVELTYKPGMQAQHQNEINEMIEDVTQKTYVYADVRTQNQDLLMTISELKNNLKTIDKGKHAKNVSNTKVTSDRSKQVTSQSTPIIEQKLQHNANVIARGMYKINQEDTKTKQSKANINVSKSTGVGSSNSVRRPKSKDNKSKNNVLKNTKSSSTYVLKTTNSVCLDSNKCETKPSNVCQTNACITSSKTVNVVNDGLNIVCISCGLDVFFHSREKCVMYNALTRKSSVKRALFTSPVAAKSKSLGATSVVAKFRFSVAKTPKATNKVIQLVLWIVDSGCSKHMTGNLQLLRNFIEEFMGTIRFGNDHFAAITGYGDYV